MKRFIAMAALCAGLMTISTAPARAQYRGWWRYHNDSDSGSSSSSSSSSDSSTSGSSSGSSNPTVSVTPLSASVTKGGTQQFAASITNSNAATTWSTTDPSGSVTASGFYTAGTTPGTYQVIATNSGVSATATAVVAIPGGGANGQVLFQDTFSSSADDNWRQNTPRPVSFGVSCSGADYPTCAQINVSSGDSGNELLSLCAAGAGDCSSSLTIPSHFFTYYKFQLSSGANVGPAGQYFKWTYFKSGNGPCASCNVCYWEAQVSNTSPFEFSPHIFCDSPSAAAVPYEPIVAPGTTWHTLEAEYYQGQYFQVWFDGTLQAQFTDVPDDVIDWIEPGLYMNGSAGSNFTIELNDFQICTGGRCP